MQRSQFFREKRLQTWLEILLFYTVLVILWGAWVRISHSGDGCGESWPLCEGQFVPDAPRKKTLVELSHRLMSGMFGIFVLTGFYYTRKIFAKHSAPRFWGGMALFLTVTEALLGAKLVLFGLVGSNDSLFRVLAMGLHFINSAMLVGSICIWSLSADPTMQKTQTEMWGLLSLKAVRRFRFGLVIILLSLGITGSIAALSTTLFPSESITSAMSSDFAESSHFILRWRISHPLLGLLFGSLGSTLFFILAGAIPSEFPWLRWKTTRTAIAFGIAMLVGLTTLFMLSPVPLKLVHLAFAHGLWISIVVWGYAFTRSPFLTSSDRPILFFDGVCHLCHKSVTLLMKVDTSELFRFAPLQGPTASRMLAADKVKDMKSLVVVFDGQVFTKSDAVLKCLEFCPAEIAILGWMGRLIPKWIRDFLYDFVANNRYQWFGEMEVCSLPDFQNPKEKERFLS